MTDAIKDADKQHWVYYAPKSWRPFLQLARYDRPIGYWLLALPGFMGLALGGLSAGLVWADLLWGVLIFVGAKAMRGAGCTYNDIIDRDLDAKVDRTALRPLPAGTVSVKQAWLWLLAQVGVGFTVWVCLPLFAKLVALASLPMVAAYPFMKRITWWPQVWLGLTFNWAVLVGFAIKTETLPFALWLFYAGLVLWTVGYDTIYACQDMEDDALIGIKSTALRFGNHIKTGVGIIYLVCCLCLVAATYRLSNYEMSSGVAFIPFAVCLLYQFNHIKENDSQNTLALFKFNKVAGQVLVLSLIALVFIITPS